MIADTAGVERRVFWPTQTLFTPLAAAILMVICSNKKTNYSTSPAHANLLPVPHFTHLSPNSIALQEINSDTVVSISRY
jgi:hypothetical protein